MISLDLDTDEANAVHSAIAFYLTHHQPSFTALTLHGVFDRLNA